MSVSNILVYGEALVDLFSNDSVVGGAPFNLARHLARFDFKPYFITAIGIDMFGELILSEYQKYNLSRQGLQIRPGYKTGVVRVHEHPEGHQFEILTDCAYDYIDAQQALECVKHIESEEFRPASAVKMMLYHGTLCLRHEVSFKAFNALLHAVPACTYLDFNWREGHVSQAVAEQCLYTATVIKVNIDELNLILGWFEIGALVQYQLPKALAKDFMIERFMSNITAHLLIVTYGELGSTVFGRDGLCLASEAVKPLHDVVDTVGAGDAFSSVMMIALATGWPLDLALRRANAFATAICGVRGAVPKDPAFYDKFIESWQLNQPWVTTKS